MDNEQTSDPRQYVPKHDSCSAQPCDLGCVDICPLSDRERRGSHDPKQSGGRDQPEGDHRDLFVVREHSQDDEQDDDRGQREYEFADAGDQAVDPSAGEACDEAGKCTDEQPGRERFGYREQGEPATVEDSAQNVAAELVGSERVAPTRPAEHGVEVLIQRFVRSDERRGDDADDEDDQPESSDRGELVRPCGRVELLQPPGCHRHVCGFARRRRHAARTCGFSQPYSRSVAKLTITTTTVKYRAIPWTTGMSCCSVTWTA